MALFVLREGFRVETTLTGGRVVHLRTGDALELTFVEVQLLARAAAGGLTADDPAMRPVVRKLASLGLLVRAAAPASPEADVPLGASSQPGLWVFEPPAGTGEDPARPVAPGPHVDLLSIVDVGRPPAVAPMPAEDFEPEIVVDEPTSSLVPTKPEVGDLVPAFRPDLVLSKKGNLFEVSDPQNGKRFSFYDFEISLSRMLNGQRTWSEVIEGGNRLGIPVSLASLTQFIRQLERYGFLSAPGAPPPPPPPESVWGKRDKWDDGIRNLFQSGLRLTRQGRYYEAAAYFEAILEHDPANSEAQEMIAQVQEHLTKLPRPLADGDLLLEEPTGPSPAVAVEPPPPELDLPSLVDVELVTSGAPAPGAEVPVALVEPPEESAEEVLEFEEAQPEPVEEDGPVAAAPFPVLSPGPDPVPPTAPPVRTSEAPPSAPPKPAPKPAAHRSPLTIFGPLTLAILALAAGWYFAIDRKPAVPAAGRDAAAVAPAGPDAAQAGMDAAQAGPDASQEEPPDAAASEPGADAALAQAEPADAAVGALPSDSRWIQVEPTRRGRVTMGEVSAARAGVVQWTVAAQARVRKGQRIGTLGDQPLKASKAGLVLPKVAEGATVEEGALLAAIVYHEGYIQTVLEAPVKPDPSWRCEVLDEASGQRAACNLVSAEPRRVGYFVTATTEPMWFDSATAPRLRIAPP